MPNISIPNRPDGGDVRSIAAILANFDAILGQANGNLEAGVNVKVGEAAAVVDGNASTEGSSSALARADHAHMIRGVERRASDPTSGHFLGRLYFNTTATIKRLMVCTDAGVTPEYDPVPGLGGIAAQDIDGTLLQVVNTSVETAIYSKVIPANLLGTSGMLRLALLGDFLNNSGADRTFIFRVKFGGTTIYSDASPAFSLAATRRPWRLDLDLANLGAANAQHMSGRLSLGRPGTADTGSGPLDEALTMDAVLVADPNPAIDTTVDQTLEVTVNHSVANANLSFRRKYACLELVTP